MIIDQTPLTRRCLAQALAQQFFGCFISRMSWWDPQRGIKQVQMTQDDLEDKVPPLSVVVDNVLILFGLCHKVLIRWQFKIILQQVHIEYIPHGQLLYLLGQVLLLELIYLFEPCLFLVSFYMAAVIVDLKSHHSPIKMAGFCLKPFYLSN